MAKLPGDTATTAQIWGTEKDFRQRSREAVSDGLLRDIVADAGRGLAPRSPIAPTPTQRGPSAPPAAIPTFAELRIPGKATTLSGAWRPRDPVDDDRGGARA
jgi:hypothetical protein